MAVATVKILGLPTVTTVAGNVKCAKIELTSQNTANRVRIQLTPLTDAFNLEMGNNFNKNLVPHLFPNIHYTMLHPAGDTCRTCAGKLESCTPSCWENDCPYTIKYCNNYPYILSKYLPGNPWSFVMLRGQIEWHFDNKIFDCFCRFGTRVNMIFHHLTSDPTNDSYMGHRFVENGTHKSIHSISNHTENKFNRISEQYRLAKLQKKSGCVTQGTIVSLKQARNIARIAMHKATDGIRNVEEAPDMAFVMANYRHAFKQGQLYLPIPIGNHTAASASSFKNRRKARTKEEMIAAGLL